MSLTVSIQQFSGGVTEVAPPTNLVKNCNYLWEIMGKYGIQAMRYNNGGGVVAGPGGGGTTGTGKIPYKLLATISGSLGSSQGTTFQSDDLINAVDLDDFLINGAPLQSNYNASFTFDYSTGTIDISPSMFLGQDKLSIPYAKYVNTNAGSISVPINTTIYFTSVETYDLAWTPALRARYGSGADFSVEILIDGVYRVTTVSIVPDSISNTTNYHFDFGGTSTGRIIF